MPQTWLGRCVALRTEHLSRIPSAFRTGEQGKQEGDIHIYRLAYSSTKTSPTLVGWCAAWSYIEGLRWRCYLSRVHACVLGLLDPLLPPFRFCISSLLRTQVEGRLSLQQQQQQQQEQQEQQQSPLQSLPFLLNQPHPRDLLQSQMAGFLPRRHQQQQQQQSGTRKSGSGARTYPLSR